MFRILYGSIKDVEDGLNKLDNVYKVTVLYFHFNSNNDGMKVLVKCVL